MSNKITSIFLALIILLSVTGAALAEGVGNETTGNDNATILDNNTVIVGDNTTGNTTDGNTTGNVTDGNTTGNTTNGNNTDGNTTGNNTNVTDGNNTNGNETDGNVTDGNETEGNNTTTVLKINDFTANVTNGTAPLKVNFTSNVTGGNITEWNWSFSPIDLSDYYSKHPVSALHTFKKVGLYNVTLTVKDAAGNTDSLTKTGYINVTEKKAPTCSKGKVYSLCGVAPYKAKFSETSTGKYTAWKWNFGDGCTSCKKLTTHTYKKAGKYTVKLSVKDKKGKWTSRTVATVNVKARK